MYCMNSHHAFQPVLYVTFDDVVTEAIRGTCTLFIKFAMKSDRFSIVLTGFIAMGRPAGCVTLGLRTSESAATRHNGTRLAPTVNTTNRGVGRGTTASVDALVGLTRPALKLTVRGTAKGLFAQMGAFIPT